ncbi:unnamed protein product, partial [Cuscuta campestris]
IAGGNRRWKGEAAADAAGEQGVWLRLARKKQSRRLARKNRRSLEEVTGGMGGNPDIRGELERATNG